VQPLTTQQKWWIATGAAAIALVGYVWWTRRSQSTPRLMVGRPPEAPAIDGYSDGDMKTTLRVSEDMSIEERLASIQKLVYKSVQDPQMRKIALQVTQHCAERDGTCEARAVYKFVKDNVRYTGDVAPIAFPDGSVDGIDLYQSARRTLEMGGGDCLPLSTLVLRDDYELVPLVALDPGDRIMGDGVWTEVQDRWITGDKPILAMHLSNGCVLRCTAEHRIFRNVDGRLEEIRADEARVGDDLVPPEAIPVLGTPDTTWPAVARGLTEEERAWLLGVFIADGWTEGKHTADGLHTYRAGISGLDGDRKEAQKRRVQELMAKIGVPTQWSPKYIRINSSELARFFAQFGHTAVNKHTTLRLASQVDARALLAGLSADADQRNNVHGTISPKMALQLRVLYRMIGQSVHITRVDDHGGFGKNPIYRVTPRTVEYAEKRRDLKFARIRAIEADGVEMCMDVTTDTGKFWLPEADVLVHNCDDQSILVATLLSLNGITPRLRVIKERKRDDWSHIYPTAGLSKNEPTQWVPLDTTLPGDNNFGVEGRYAEAIDFPA
jgi:hypothetical protein